MNYKVQINPSSQIVKRLGLDKSGKAQMYHTQNVLRRIQRYMPFRGGMLIKRMIAATDIKKPFIVVPGPSARMLYHGKIMVDPKTGAAGFLTKDGWRSRRGVKKVVSNRDIEYTKTKNPQAGPYWDRRLSAAEGKIMAKELENYVRRG